MYLHRFVVLVVADQHDVIRYIGFLQVFHRNVFVSVNVERNQIHFTPYNAVHDVMYLLVKHDVSAFQQRVHRIPYDTQSSVAFGDQCRLHDLDDRLAVFVCKQRNKTSDGLHVIYRYLLAVNQTIGSQFENLIYGNIGDILLVTLLSFRVFGI